MGTIRPWYTIPLYDDNYDDCCLCRDVQEVVLGGLRMCSKMTISLSAKPGAKRF